MKAPAQTSRVHAEPRTGVWPQQVVGAPDWWLERRRSAQDQLIKGGYGAVHPVGTAQARNQT